MQPMSAATRTGRAGRAALITHRTAVAIRQRSVLIGRGLGEHETAAHGQHGLALLASLRASRLVVLLVLQRADGHGTAGTADTIEASASARAGAETRAGAKANAAQR